MCSAGAWRHSCDYYSDHSLPLAIKKIKKTPNKKKSKTTKKNHKKKIKQLPEREVPVLIILFWEPWQAGRAILYFIYCNFGRLFAFQGPRPKKNYFFEWHTCHKGKFFVIGHSAQIVSHFWQFFNKVWYCNICSNQIYEFYGSIVRFSYSGALICAVILYFDTSENKNRFFIILCLILLEFVFLYIPISIERSLFMERYFERTSFMDVIQSFMEVIRAFMESSRSFMEYNSKGMHICAEFIGFILKRLL